MSSNDLERNHFEELPENLKNAILSSDKEPFLEWSNGNREPDQDGRIYFPAKTDFDDFLLMGLLFSAIAFFLTYINPNISRFWPSLLGFLTLLFPLLYFTQGAQWILDFRHQKLLFSRRIIIFYLESEISKFSDISCVATDCDERRASRNNTGFGDQIWWNYSVCIGTKTGELHRLTIAEKEMAHTCDVMAKSLANCLKTNHIPLQKERPLTMIRNQELGYHLAVYDEKRFDFTTLEDRLDELEQKIDFLEDVIEGSDDEELKEMASEMSMDDLLEIEADLEEEVSFQPLEASPKNPFVQHAQEEADVIDFSETNSAENYDDQLILENNQAIKKPLLWIFWFFSFMLFMTWLNSLHTAWFKPLAWLSLFATIISFYFWATSGVQYVFDSTKRTLTMIRNMGGVKTISEIGNYADLCSFATKCRRTETRYDILWDYCVLLCLRDETIIELTPWSFVEFNSYNRLAKELAQRVGSFYTKGKRDNELFTIFNDKKNCYVFKYYE